MKNINQQTNSLKNLKDVKDKDLWESFTLLGLDNDIDLSFFETVRIDLLSTDDFIGSWE